MKRLFKLLCFMLCIAAGSMTLLTLQNPVKAEAATVKLTKSKITLDEGRTYTLKVTGTTRTVKWTSSDKKVAAVSSKGKVTAVAKGSATITATVNGKTYTCKVTVNEIFNAKKAIDNINAELEDLGNGVVAILDNNYIFSFSLDATVVYFDEGGSMLGKSSDNNYYFEKGKQCALYFSGPHDNDYNNVAYASYEISYTVSTLSDSIKSNLSDVSIESNIGADNVMVKVKNDGEQTAEFTQVGIIFYKGGIAVGYDYGYADVQNPGSEDYMEFSFPYDSNFNTIPVDDYKVFVNFSYYYTW